MVRNVRVKRGKRKMEEGCVVKEKLVKVIVRYPIRARWSVWVEFWSLGTEFENTRFSKIQLGAKTDLGLLVYLL